MVPAVKTSTKTPSTHGHKVVVVVVVVVTKLDFTTSWFAAFAAKDAKLVSQLT